MAPKSSKHSDTPEGSATPPAFTTMDFFLDVSLPRSHHSTETTCNLSDVAKIYKCMFHTFKVKPWPNFNKNASKVLAGENSKPISNGMVSRVNDARESISIMRPMGEAALVSMFDQAVLQPANVIQRYAEDSGLAWGYGSHIRTGENQPGLEPDIALKPRGAGSSSQSRNVPIVVGEMKLPCYSLRGAFTPDHLTHKIRHQEYLEYNGLDPFYQALSYAIHSQTGVAFLSNFDENRYFKVNIRSKEIWVSDLVKVEQRLDQRRETPHALQALLYTKSKEELDKKEFSATLVDELVSEGKKRLDAEKKKREEEEEKKKKRSSSSRADGAGSSKDHAKGGKSKKRSDSLFPPVSCVLHECKLIGVLGEGATGEVKEFDYKGERVAVKWGSKNYSSDVDCMEHVENEIGIYELLNDLQGSVIPRMIEGGLDPVYSASMVLITEKVGMAVEETEREISVGGKPLDRENLIMFKEKGLEGLRKIRGRGVVHGDGGMKNMRVEMRDGKVERVCWIDFGFAHVVEDEGRSRKWTEGEDDVEVEAKSEESEDEESENLEYPEEMIETAHTRSFEAFVDRYISYTDE